MRPLLIPLLPLLVGLAHAGTAEADAGHRVLLVYDGGREFSSIQIMDRSIEATLNEDLSSQAMIFREYMDLTRIRAPGYEGVLREFYRSKYSKDQPDAIVAVRGRALDFLLNDGDPLFPDVLTCPPFPRSQNVSSGRSPRLAAGGLEGAGGAWKHTSRAAYSSGARFPSELCGRTWL
jgi:hypothetical protein